MENIKVGTCDICEKREVLVERKYYHHKPGCKEHNEDGFTIVRYCHDCTRYIKPDCRCNKMRPSINWLNVLILTILVLSFLLILLT